VSKFFSCTFAGFGCDVMILSLYYLQLFLFLLLFLVLLSVLFVCVSLCVRMCVCMIVCLCVCVLLSMGHVPDNKLIGLDWIGSHIWEIDWYQMNDLNLCLEVASRSRQPLNYIWRWISQKPLEIEAWFQRNTNRKWHMGYQMVTWPMMSRDPERSNSWHQYA